MSTLGNTPCAAAGSAVCETENTVSRAPTTIKKKTPGHKALDAMINVAADHADFFDSGDTPSITVRCGR